MGTLKEFRLNNNLKQCDAAKKLGITKDYLYMLEAGKRTPSTKLISEMAKLYKMPPEDIFLVINRTICSIEQGN